MPEAVIVSVARSPIGRANKGSLKDFRPDDLAALIVRTALDKIPALDPNTVDDLYLGCGLPGGDVRQQHGARRQRAQRHGRRPRRHRHPLLRLVGADHPDGLPRHQGRRGRRLRLRRRRDGLELRARAPPTTGRHPEPALRGRAGADEGSRRGRPSDWHDPREDGQLPDAYIAMGQTAENVARLRGLRARSSTSSASAPRTSPRRRSRTASGRARSPRSPPPTAPWSPPTTAPAPA